MQNPSALPAWRGGIDLPLIVGVTQGLGLFGVTRVQSLWKDPKKYRQRNEGTGDFDKG
jgi:hypothetical protein